MKILNAMEGKVGASTIVYLSKILRSVFHLFIELDTIRRGPVTADGAQNSGGAIHIVEYPVLDRVIPCRAHKNGSLGKEEQFRLGNNTRVSVIWSPHTNFGNQCPP